MTTANIIICLVFFLHELDPYNQIQTFFSHGVLKIKKILRTHRVD